MLWLAWGSRLVITNSASRSWSRRSVPNVPPNWPSAQPAVTGLLFKLTANTGYRCKAGWPASIVRTGSRPGGCPGPIATELAPKKSALPSHVPKRAREGLSFPGPEKTKACISLVKLPSGGPGLSNAKTRPAALPGASKWNSLRDTRFCLHGRVSYPALLDTVPPARLPNLRNQPGGSVRTLRAINVARYKKCIESIASCAAEPVGIGC
jgi:hypothetical protein